MESPNKALANQQHIQANKGLPCNAAFNGFPLAKAFARSNEFFLVNVLEEPASRGSTGSSSEVMALFRIRRDAGDTTVVDRMTAGSGAELIHTSRNSFVSVFFCFA